LSDKNLSYEELLQIVKVFESSSEFSEFHLKYGDIEVDLRKHGAAAAPASAAKKAAVAVEAPTATVPEVQAPPKAQPAQKQEEQAVAPAASAVVLEGASTVTSPMVGTFYRAPEPGAQPFVTVGQRVTPDTTVCIIEVMKLMTSIRAGHAGVVTQILVNDAEPVEFGQALIVIDTNG
jgi:acetyl-CoA carboxylase biotin carboxyl carrier protein